MSKRKLELERVTKERVLLAKDFLLSQKSVPECRNGLERKLRAFAKLSEDKKMLRSDELLAALKEMPEKYSVDWKTICRKRSIRSESGVAVIAILTDSFGCPGKCIYCPTPGDMPKSYLPNEPAVSRAIAADFSPDKQIRMRLKALDATGHDTSKVELIVMGGTWSALPPDYQSQYIRSCFYALNDGKGGAKSLEAEQKKNESASHRCVGLTLETRPDWVTEEEIKKMRKFGCTRVEIGVQSLYDEVHSITNRGHGVEEVVHATKMLRDAGFKVVYHMMLNLPGSNPKKDIEMFRTLFSDPRFCPDQVKIYPCVLVDDSELVDWYKSGRWEPYTDSELTETIIEIKKFIPEYCRVIRVIRDIPSDDILAGSKISNLRQILQEKGMKCRCIRCREIRGLVPKEVKLIKREYETVGGKEIFLSYEDPVQDKLLAILRLRIPSDVLNEDHEVIFSSLKNAALIRELHVYGMQTPVGARGDSAQHKGLGKKLLSEAEKIVIDMGIKKIAVISGIGVRDYYKKQEYEVEDGGYLCKRLAISSK
jgi:elongator complex protein 3